MLCQKTFLEDAFTRKLCRMSHLSIMTAWQQGSNLPFQMDPVCTRAPLPLEGVCLALCDCLEKKDGDLLAILKKS